jgi:tetrahydromethanopterin S-methyltransferase subunit G
MSAETATTMIMIVALLAALTAWVAWLGMRNNGHAPRECNGCHVHTHVSTAHTHEHSHLFATAEHYHPHEHDEYYSPRGHEHDYDERYAPLDHAHDEYAPVGHSHQEYVTQEQLTRRLAGIERRLAFLHTQFVQSPIGILLGILFGGLIGAVVGLILDLTLPRSVFEVHGTTTFNVNGQQIVQQLTAYNAWPKWGIPLGCIVVGMLLGGLVLWALGTYRNRRQDEDV